MDQNLKDMLDICASFNAMPSDASVTERLTKIRIFLEEVSVSPSSIPDFNVGLEWFNCEEPLSLGRQLRGKVVVLDFFTYCCVNCLHILPHLHELEERYSIEDGVVIVGVHSAKFDNEKDSANILAALKRYNISHPVVNDSEGELWLKLGISCWPTILVLGPKGQPLFQLIGEFIKEDLFDFVRVSVDFFKSCGAISSHKLPLSPLGCVIKGPLLFPGKITSTVKDDGSELIAIANTGLHCIIIASADGQIKLILGGCGQPGFTDGTYSDSLFNAPQGLAFSSPHVLFVADTGNHAIRKVNLKDKCITTVASKGVTVPRDPACEIAQCPSSPWDLCYVRRRIPSQYSLPQRLLSICPPAPLGYQKLSPALPASSHSVTSSVPSPPLPPQTNIFLDSSLFVHPPQIPPPPPSSASTSPSSFSLPPSKSNQVNCDANDFIEQEILFIAMAGSHQIWALFFQDTLLWGREFFSSGTCARIAGSGKEANRNNLYPLSASFAQPSGLAYCPDSDDLLVADSESSCIRCLNLKTGKVSAIVGGSKFPDDLFSFGDVDGDGFSAKLQHPLGVAWHEDSKKVLVADSYNHKVKSVKLETLACESFIGTGQAGNSLHGLASQFNEPGGLCVSVDQSKIYIADTNNHCIKIFHFASSSLIELDLYQPNQEQLSKDNATGKATPLKVKPGGKITFFMKIVLTSDFKLTEGAPQCWTLKLPDSSWETEFHSGALHPVEATPITLTVPNREQTEQIVELSCQLFVCTEGICKRANSTIEFTVQSSAADSEEIWEEVVFSA